MRTRPPELTDADVLGALDRGWGLPTAAIEYRPVGFGSHHWSVVTAAGRWFLTVDDLAAKVRSRREPWAAASERLRAALTVARDLRDGGLSFVVAPRRTVRGDVLVPVGDRFAAALYPHVGGAAGAWGDDGDVAERTVVLDLVVQVHAATSSAAAMDDVVVPMRDVLLEALDDTARPWTSGPFAERARALLVTHARGVERLLVHHDRMAAAVIGRPERMVLTHGEPHPGNTIATSAGPMLVDWDTVRSAPPERDLWTVAGPHQSLLDRYARATGRAVLDEVLDTYRLSWDVGEIAGYIALLRAEHEDTADLRESWRNLRHFLDPAARWPALTG